jgi:DNA repair protein RecO (recombination protein O)
MHNTFLPDKYYRFIPEQGFVLSDLGGESTAESTLFAGKNLLAIAKEDWHDNVVLQDAKRLTRLILAPLLGSRPLYSRRLFMQPNEKRNDENEA